MRLFHGSNVIVDQPKIITPNRPLDFGKGFYLTSLYHQGSRQLEYPQVGGSAGRY